MKPRQRLTRKTTGDVFRAAKDILDGDGRVIGEDLKVMAYALLHETPHDQAMYIARSACNVMNRVPLIGPLVALQIVYQAGKQFGDKLGA